MLATVSSFFTTLILTASCWYFLVMSRIGFGMVAENSTVWCSPGIYSNTVSMSSRNPIFNISSASSKTMVWTKSGRMVFLRRWSIKRPGVPIIICTPPFRALIWREMSCPPYTGSTFTPCIYFASLRISSATWMASSLVGDKIKTCVFRKDGSTFCKIGIPKAAVLPVPVWACPITSTPDKTTGIAWLWIGVASSNPMSAIPLKICGFKSNSSNLIVFILFLPVAGTFSHLSVTCSPVTL